MNTCPDRGHCLNEDLIEDLRADIQRLEEERNGYRTMVHVIKAWCDENEIVFDISTPKPFIRNHRASRLEAEITSLQKRLERANTRITELEYEPEKHDPNNAVLVFR